MKEILRGDRILIRTYDEADIQSLFEAASGSVKEVSPWLPWCHNNYSIEESIEWVKTRKQAWENGDEYSFVVEHLESKKFIGGVGINQINLAHGIGNLGYWIRTDETGRGYAPEAAKLAARFGLKSLGLNRIEIIMSIDNIYSRKVAEKTGAKKECIARNRLLINNVLHNAYIFSLIKDDLN